MHCPSSSFQILGAGPLTLHYDPDAGDVRGIYWGDQEILRRVYAAVRDDNWFTVPVQVTETERTLQPDSFRIVYDACYRHENIAFDARVTLTGTADGTVSFTFEGEAVTDFQRNRIGICVLHPHTLAGSDCTVTHSDGADEAGQFPELIAPHQPFFDIATIAHQVAPGVRASVRFDGDVFEMEDQRNWLDASFKTYSTPLALPYPVPVARGTRIYQTVTLSVSGPAALDLPPRNIDLVICTIGAIRDAAPPLIHLQQGLQHSDIAPNFAELNRTRPSTSGETGAPDCVRFAGNPQVHAFDEASILETPPIIEVALRSARAFTDAPLCLGPLTFYGPYQPDDPRQKTAFAAIWYFAAITHAIYGGAAEITLCEAVGPRGVQDHDGTPYPVRHLLQRVREHMVSVNEITVSDTRAIAALAAGTGKGTGLFVANLTDSMLPVMVCGLPTDGPCTAAFLIKESGEGFGVAEAVTADADGTYHLMSPGYSIAHLYPEGRN